MKIKLEKIGLLDSAEFEVNDLTIICGDNNTGKTYAAYALYGFLSEWRMLVQRINFNILTEEHIADLYHNHTLTVDMDVLAKKVSDIFTYLEERYIKALPTILSSNKEFMESKFTFQLTSADIEARLEKLAITNTRLAFYDGFQAVVKFGKDAGNIQCIISISSFDKDELSKTLFKVPLKHTIESLIARCMLSEFLPDAFITTTERTGVSIFRDELNINRANLLDTLKEEKLTSKRFISLQRNLQKSRYALPVSNNLNFVNDLNYITKTDSYIAQKHDNILKEFQTIIGGQYVVNEGVISFVPNKNKKARLAMSESSSSVRSMVHLSFYLQHRANKGDILIIDEPELNLHPKNQRKIARLLARLVNIGIKVFITTHSDHIMREMTSLLILNQDKEYIKKIRTDYKYRSDELLKAKNVSVYIADDNTLTPAEVTQETGIELKGFDDVIMQINEVQDAVIWGDDDE